jgi:hypothetical protein
MTKLQKLVLEHFSRDEWRRAPSVGQVHDLINACVAKGSLARRIHISGQHTFEYRLP